MPKFCPNCGKNIPRDVKFCPECGANINSFLSVEKETSSNNSHIPVTSPVNTQGADCSAPLDDNVGPAIINHVSAIEKPSDKSHHCSLEMKKAPISRKGAFAAGCIVLIAIITVGGFFVYPMLFPQPGDVVFQAFQLMKNGEYSKSIDLIADMRTEGALSQDVKTEAVNWLKSRDWANIPAVKTETLTLISSDKIDETHYLITYKDSWVDTDISGKTTEKSVVRNTRIVKLDGQWKVVGITWISF